MSWRHASFHAVLAGSDWSRSRKDQNGRLRLLTGSRSKAVWRTARYWDWPMKRCHARRLLRGIGLELVQIREAGTFASYILN